MTMNLRKMIVEGAALLLSASLIGLGFNSVRTDAISLTRNYFPKSISSAGDNLSEGSGVNVDRTPPASAPHTNLGDPPSTQPGVDQPLKHEFLTVSLEQVYQEFEQANLTTFFVDAREDQYFQEAHIPGAIQFDYYHPERYLAGVLQAAQAAEKIIIYCNGGTCEDSILAARYLTAEIDTPLEFNKVLVFEGGMVQWKAAGYPVSTGSEP